MRRRQVKHSYQYAPLDLSKNKRVVGNVKTIIFKRNWWRGVWHYGLYAVAGVVAVYLLLFSNIFQINNISVQGPNTTLSQDLQKETEKYLNSRLFGRNWLILNTKDLRSTLQKSFNGQESISVDKVFPSRLIIKTDEQKPGLIWKTGARRYVISVNGRVMSEIPHDQSSDLVVVVDTSNIPVEIGDNVTGRQFVTFTTEIYKALRENNLGPSELYIRETTGELNAKTTQGYDIKFDTTVDSAVQIRALNAVLELLKSSNKKPTEYIDLRINGKAFYR